MEVTIENAGLERLGELLAWRETVLREVFSLPAEADLTGLMAENRRYYEAALPRGEHTACFAVAERKIVGCGGICWQKEMPSPDNPQGTCGCLMNIYTLPQHRGAGVGAKIVQWLITEANRRETGKIYLEASQKGASLYRKLGFEALNGYMKL